MIRKLLYRFDIFLTKRFFIALSLVFVLFLAGFVYPFLLPAIKITALVLGFILLIDGFILFVPGLPLSCERHTTDKWSLGDQNPVSLLLKNKSYMAWKLNVIDELPIEIQERNFNMKCSLNARANEKLQYFVRPTARGSLVYGSIRVLMKTPMGFMARRLSFAQDTTVGVYPSILQMKKYSLYTLNRISVHSGIKKLRRIGHSYEFEQIKDYVRGDDMRHVNWKATGRSQILKTNHFVEERAQPVYCIIDKSRVMNLAFNEMTLLDYSINASLVISNTALQKGDRAGLITFSDRIGTAVRADNSSGQLKRILDNLYHQKYRSTESDYEYLYNAVRRVINTRSLVFLFTNFESIYALHRVLPVLRRLNMLHLLVVIFFENDELEQFAYQPANSHNDIYQHIIARQMVIDKRQMAIELANHGVQTLVTKPGDLTINALNKYLELKAKGLV